MNNQQYNFKNFFILGNSVFLVMFLIIILQSPIQCKSQNDILEQLTKNFECKDQSGDESDQYNKQWMNIIRKFFEAASAAQDMEGINIIRVTQSLLKMIRVQDYDFLGHGAEFISSQPFLELFVKRLSQLLDMIQVYTFQVLGIKSWGSFNKSVTYFAYSMKSGGTIAQSNCSRTHIGALKAAEADAKLKKREFKKYLSKISSAKPCNVYQEKSIKIRTAFIQKISKMSDKFENSFMRLKAIKDDLSCAISRLEALLALETGKKKEKVKQLLETLKEGLEKINEIVSFLDETASKIAGWDRGTGIKMTE